MTGHLVMGSGFSIILIFEVFAIKDGAGLRIDR